MRAQSCVRTIASLIAGRFWLVLQTLLTARLRTVHQVRRAPFDRISPPVTAQIGRSQQAVVQQQQGSRAARPAGVLLCVWTDVALSVCWAGRRSIFLLYSNIPGLWLCLLRLAVLESACTHDLVSRRRASSKRAAGYDGAPGAGSVPSGWVSTPRHRGKWLSILRSVPSRTECQPVARITSPGLTFSGGEMRCDNWLNEIQVTRSVATTAKHAAGLPVESRPAFGFLLRGPPLLESINSACMLLVRVSHCRSPHRKSSDQTLDTGSLLRPPRIVYMMLLTRVRSHVRLNPAPEARERPRNPRNGLDG